MASNLSEIPAPPVAGQTDVSQGRAASGPEDGRAESKPLGEPTPLSPEHMRILTEARVRARKIRRAAKFANASGATLAMFAVVSLMFSLLGDRMSMVIGAALGVLAWNELRGSQLLGALRERAARRLGWNQVALGVLIVAYSAWSATAMQGGSLLAAPPGGSGDAEVDRMMDSMSKEMAPMVSMVSLIFYALVSVLGVLTTGLTAWYYFSRAKILRRLVEATPAWAVDAMRIMG